MMKKTSHITSELFFEDTACLMDIVYPANAFTNEGFSKRAEMTKLTASVDMINRLHLEMFHQDRLLLNMVDLKIKLISSNPEFCLLAGEGEYIISQEHDSLCFRKVRFRPRVVLEHAKS